jgi:hypothetical protein
MDVRQFFAERLKQAETLQEVADLHKEIKATQKAARGARLLIEYQIGKLLAHRRAAGLMNKGGRPKKELQQ